MSCLSNARRVGAKAAQNSGSELIDVENLNDFNDGRVAEWFKATVLKTVVGASPP
jgi:hypothetical protein